MVIHGRMFFAFLAMNIVVMHILAQPPSPDLNCIAINGSEVTLSWTNDFEDFDYYFLNKSIDGTNFVLLESFPKSQGLSYTYNETTPVSDILYYFIYTEGAQGKSHDWDTLATINLDVTSLFNNGIALLEWNDPSPGSGEEFKILRKDPLSAWDTIGSTPELSWQDIITYPYCDEDTLLYYQIITTSDNGSCFCSNIDSGNFHDVIPPGGNVDPVEMDTVSVDVDGNVLISWIPAPDKDIDHYVVWRILTPGGTADEIAEVPSDVYSYMDYGSPVALQSVGYGVYAVDQCGQRGIGGYNNPFYTIFLQPLAWDFCDTAIELVWNPIEWMDPLPEFYSIHSIDVSDFTKTAFVAQTQLTQFTYETGFKPDSTYCFFIRAGNSLGKSTTSCIQCFDAIRPDQPDSLNFLLASVDTSFNDRINLTVLVDTVPSQTKCLILRKSDQSATIDTIALIPVYTNNMLSITDTTADPSAYDYDYEVFILDYCSNKAWLPENRITTIHLDGSVFQNSNHLFWNSYRSSLCTVSYYLLHRIINGFIDTSFNVGQDTQYYDYLDNAGQKSGRFAYLVEARMAANGPISGGMDSLSSFSNEVLVAQISRIYMPNAFTPNADGINDDFGPENLFTEEDAEFIFQIFNRWGQKIYESSNINDRWDGNVNGFPGPEGVYLYLVRYISEDGTVYEAKGPFTLLR
jgi:gliding motility-associated-like protein